MDVFFIALGIALLYFGGELLVTNASKLARIWGLSPLVIGLTVVAFGTSAPELAASLTAALQGSAALAIGNVVGSNIANIALILGVAALLHPLRTEARFIRREVPIMIVVAGLLVLLFRDGSLGRFEGALFLTLLALYLWVLLRGSEQPQVEAAFAEAYAGGSSVTSPRRTVLGALAGLALLVIGAQLLITGATALARSAGVPELVIGLSLVAVGTSLPELATSVIAALKRESDIALGNIVGSNIFNILGILGVTTLVQPVTLPYAEVALDLWLMLGLSLLMLPFLLTGLRLGRREAAVLLLLYALYLGYLYL
ncbi:MAG: calcium/sodium antiporter [Deinococcota bacterium]|nr:calcium/sodium antiporter [Deinococcota bacterium]